MRRNLPCYSESIHLWIAVLVVVFVFGMFSCDSEKDNQDNTDGDTENDTDYDGDFDKDSDDETVTLFDGLKEDVKIIKDSIGIPHIYAQNDLDLFFAAGYQLALDRLFQLDVNRRRATGRLAEVFGESELKSDKLMRTIGISKIAEESIELMNVERPNDWQLVVAYTAGINRRVQEITSGDAELPPDYQSYGFTPESFTQNDLTSVGIMTVFGFSSTMEFDMLASVLEKLIPEVDQLPIYKPAGSAHFMQDSVPESTGNKKQSISNKAQYELSARDFAELESFTTAVLEYRKILRLGEGSNNWAISGDYTENGFPILANDSHAHYGYPSNMYLMHLNSADAGGNFNVMGLLFPGVPGVQVGNTAKVAWGATTNFADVMDIWDVATTDDDKVMIGNQKISINTRSEDILVKKEDGTIETEEFEIRKVDGYGVLIPEDILPIPSFLFTSGNILLNWVGFTPSHEVFQYLDYDRMETLDDFVAATDLQISGMHNWLAASSEGFKLMAHGRVPDRGPKDNRARANRILDGSDPDTFWTGDVLPDEQLPYLDNTMRPFVVTGNNDPWGHTDDNDPLNDEFYYGSYYSPGFRATRLSGLLSDMISDDPITLEDMQELQMDSYSTLAAGLVPMLANAAQLLDTDETLSAYKDRTDIKEAINSLSEWDLMVTRDSEAAALFRIWCAFLSKRTLGDDISLFFEDLDDAQPVTMTKFTLLIHMDKIAAFLDGSSELLMIEAMDDALKEIDARMVEKFTWSDILEAVFDNPAGEIIKRESKNGDDSSVNVSQSHCWDSGEIMERCYSSAGSVYRLIWTFDADGKIKTYYNMPYGFGDQIEDWLKGDYKLIPYEYDAVVADKASEKLLQP